MRREDLASDRGAAELLHICAPDSRSEFFGGGHLFMVQDRAAYGRVVEFLLGPG